MKTDFLKELGISEDVIAKIQLENGKDITAEKAKFADYDDVKTQLKTANDTINGFGDVEAIKADVIKYKADAETAKADADKRVIQLETQSKVKEFTASKQFVNALTKEAIENKLLAELENEASKGKSFDDLFKVITEGQENLLVDPNKPAPPIQTPLGGGGTSAKTAENTMRSAMGLPAIETK